MRQGLMAFLALASFIVILTGNAIVILKYVVCISIAYYFLKKMLNRVKVDKKVVSFPIRTEAIQPVKPVKPVKLSLLPKSLDFHIVEKAPSFNELMDQVIMQIGDHNDSSSVLNEKFLLVTDLWDITLQIPGFMQRAIFKKICWEQLRIFKDPTIDKTFGVRLTTKDIFRTLEHEEKKAFINFCLTH